MVLESRRWLRHQHTDDAGRVLQKLEVRDRAQAIVLAYQCGLFDDAETAGT